MSDLHPGDLSRDKQLAHDIANDLNALAMTLLALPVVRNDQVQFAKCVEHMQENVESLTKSSEEVLRMLDKSLRG